MLLTEAYATVDEADAYLSLDTAWLGQSDEVKEDALLWGRYYIDSEFSCSYTEDGIPEEFKLANSLLARDYTVQGDLYFNNEKSIKIEFVKAGDVEAETTYRGSSKTRPNSLSKAKAVLAEYCQGSNSLTRA